MQIAKKGTNLFRLNCVCKKCLKCIGNFFGLCLKCLGNFFGLCLKCLGKFFSPIVPRCGKKVQAPPDKDHTKRYLSNNF